MTPFLWILSGTVLVLLVLFIWSLRGISRTRKGLGPLEDRVSSHVQYFPQIQQALSFADYEFLVANGGPELARRTKRDRRKVAAQFLDALQAEFKHLLRQAREIAALSPEVAPMQEFERLRLTAMFEFRLQFMRLRLFAGTAPVHDFNALSNVVSRLSVRMEGAMRELGERAALATEMLSTIERSDVHLS
jgi:hypothetical protein